MDTLCFDDELSTMISQYVTSADASGTLVDARMSAWGLSSEVKSEITQLLDSHRIHELRGDDSAQLALLRSLNYNSENQKRAVSRMLLFEEDMPSCKDDLLLKIRDKLPPSLRSDPSRLHVLLDQARRFQESRCLCHDSCAEQRWSLLYDHFCEPSMSVPNILSGRLDGHREEVWTVAVSGRYLASASKDRSICIWSLETFQPVAVLNGHGEPCTCLAWSGDGSLLLSGGNDCSVRLWAPLAATTLVRQFEYHKESVSGIVWLDSTRFFSSSTDKSVALWTVGGCLVSVWTFGGRVTDLGILQASGLLASVAGEREITLINVKNEECWHDEPLKLTETHPIVALTSSALRNELLAATARNPPTLHLWDLTGRRILQTYRGHSQGKFVLRPAFVGNEEQLVACGSEDGKTFLWNRIYGCVVSSFDAHAGPVNSVVWSLSTDSLITASDDRTLKVWTNKRVRDRRRSRADSNFTDD